MELTTNYELSIVHLCVIYLYLVPIFVGAINFICQRWPILVTQLH